MVSLHILEHCGTGYGDVRDADAATVGEVMLIPAAAIKLPSHSGLTMSAEGTRQRINRSMHL